MSDVIIQRGDYGFYLTGAVTNDDGSAFDLTGYTLTFKAWEEGNWEHPVVDSTAEVVSDTQGTWQYLVKENDFITAKKFYIAVRATKENAQETTRNYTLEVKESP